MNQQDHDRRSLALHRLVATKVRSNPPLLDRARSILERWQAMASGGERYYLNQWQSLLAAGQETCLARATEESELACALRQSSPLSCLLTVKERQDFMRQWKLNEAS
jgi:hypothetical protein